MSNKERKLTPAEEKRKEYFEKICEDMEQKGYLKKDLTVSVLQANIMAMLIMLPFAIVAVVIYRVINPDSSINLAFHETIVLLIALIILTVLHEAIHGLTWGIFAKNHLKSINFGVIWEMLTPYCTCSEPLTKWQYIAGGAMPALVLGFGLLPVAIVLESFFTLVLSVFMIFAGGGDFFIILKMLLYRNKNKEVLFFDHPYECGLVAFEKADE